jgi:hypothetical protein
MPRSSGRPGNNIDTTAGRSPRSSHLLATTSSPFTTRVHSKHQQEAKEKRMHQPTKNSLYDIMHRHAGTSLFVRPIFWTDQHLNLLNIRFEQLPPCDTPVPIAMVGWPPSKGHLQPSPAIRMLSDSLDELLAPPSWQSVQNSIPVKAIMSQLWPNAFRSSRILPEMDLYFGAKKYCAAVRAPLIWDFPMLGTPTSPYMSHSTATKPHPTSPPMICYIGKRRLALMRKNKFRVKRRPKGNQPVVRLQRLRWKKLSPANRDEDPYLAGIFLAMAQRHVLRNGKINMKVRFQDVKLRILMEDTDKSAFVVYTATVTRQFLERFHDPFSTPGNSTTGLGELPGMKIEYTDVPLWPILGLRERLGKAMGKDIVGPFDPDVMEPWMDGEGPVPASSASERKHGALDEVVDVTLEPDMGEETVVGQER